MSKIAQSVLDNAGVRDPRRGAKQREPDSEAKAEKERQLAGKEFTLFVCPSIAKLLREAAEKEGRPKPKLKIYKADL